MISAESVTTIPQAIVYMVQQWATLVAACFVVNLAFRELRRSDR